jgi:hypothetical protein
MRPTTQLGMPEVQELEARYGVDDKARVKY